MSNETTTIEATTIETPKEDSQSTEETKITFDDKQEAYIKDMLDKAMRDSQSETDRRVNQFVKDNKSLTKKLEELQKSNMTKEQQTEYEISEKSTRLKEMEQQLIRNQLNFDKLQYLAEKGLSKDYLALVHGDSIEEFEKGISLIEQIKKNEVENIVKQKLAGSSPQPMGSGISSKQFFTQAEVKEMSEKDVELNIEKIRESIPKWTN